MSRLITVVCRHNQARSVMAAAALPRYFPDVEVASAGIAALESQRIPQSILNLADAWGLEVQDVVSHALQDAQERLLKSDYVVVAEDEFVPYVVELGIEANKVLSMQDSRFEHALIPFDPIGQGDRVLSAELAKAIMTTMQLLRAQEGFGSNYPVEASFSQDEGDLRLNFDRAWEKACKSGGIVLAADFRAPNFQAISQVCGGALELGLGRVDGRITFTRGVEEWDIQRILMEQEPIAISGRFEMDLVEKFALSAQFTGLIATLATSKPITILTEPKGLGPCAFLVAANANI